VLFEALVMGAWLGVSDYGRSGMQNPSSTVLLRCRVRSAERAGASLHEDFAGGGVGCIGNALMECRVNEMSIRNKVGRPTFGKATTPKLGCNAAVHDEPVIVIQWAGSARGGPGHQVIGNPGAVVGGVNSWAERSGAGAARHSAED